MAASSGVYLADDLNAPSMGAPNSWAINRKFKATLSNMLAQTGAAKFLAGDIILLAPLPPQCNFVRYRIYVPNMDTGSGAALNVGDTQVLPAALTRITSGTVLLPPVGQTFTLTCTTSTTGFTAVNGALAVGPDLIVNYESLSGNTFVNCRTFQTGAVIANGAPVQQLLNMATYQSANTAGVNNAAGVMTQDAPVGVAGVLPTIMPPAFMTAAYRVGATGPTFGNFQPYFFLIQFNAAITTLGVTTNAIVGEVDYYMQGF